MYLTYDEYIEYGGKVDETTFSQLEFKCEQNINFYTADRLKDVDTISEAVKRCVFDLINQEQIYNDNVKTLLTANSDGNSGRLVSSFSTDGYQETYATGGADAGTYTLQVRKSIDSAEKLIIKSYLQYERTDDGTLLLYRGVF